MSLGDIDGTSSHQSPEILISPSSQNEQSSSALKPLPGPPNSSFRSQSDKRRSILVIHPLPSPTSEESESSLMSGTSARTSSSSSTSASAGSSVARSASTSSGPLSHPPCITFAPLPHVEPRKGRRSGKLGVAGRAALLRNRVPRGYHQQGVYSGHYDYDTGHSAIEVYMDREPRGGSEEHKKSIAPKDEDDAFVALGKLLNDAGRLLWRRVTKKRSTKDVSSATLAAEQSGLTTGNTAKGEGPSVDGKDDFIGGPVAHQTIDEGDVLWEVGEDIPSNAFMKPITEDTDEEDGLGDVYVLQSSTDSATVEVRIVNSPSSSVE